MSIEQPTPHTCQSPLTHIMVKPVQHEFCLTAITCEMLPICTALLQFSLLYEHEETTLKFNGYLVLVFITFVLRVPYCIHFIWPSDYSLYSFHMASWTGPGRTLCVPGYSWSPNPQSLERIFSRRKFTTVLWSKNYVHTKFERAKSSNTVFSSRYGYLNTYEY